MAASQRKVLASNYQEMVSSLLSRDTGQWDILKLNLVENSPTWLIWTAVYWSFKGIQNCHGWSRPGMVAPLPPPTVSRGLWTLSSEEHWGRTQPTAEPEASTSRSQRVVVKMMPFTLTTLWMEPLLGQSLTALLYGRCGLQLWVKPLWGRTDTCGTVDRSWNGEV